MQIFLEKINKEFTKTIDQYYDVLTEQVNKITLSFNNYKRMQSMD